MATPNEFENLDVENDFPDQTTAPVPGKQSDIISSGSAGTVYDYNSAPDSVKAPPRVDMNGMTVIIKKAELILPSMDKPWMKTRDGKKECKSCIFAIHYDNKGQIEFYSGIRIFKTDDGKYSHPSMTKDRNNQASRLLGLYADFKQKDINEVSLKEFFSYLNSEPKVKIVSEEVLNPTTKEKIRKNMIGSFV